MEVGESAGKVQGLESCVVAVVKWARHEARVKQSVEMVHSLAGTGLGEWICGESCRPSKQGVLPQFHHVKYWRIDKAVEEVDHREACTVR